MAVAFQVLAKLNPLHLMAAVMAVAHITGALNCFKGHGLAETLSLPC